MNANAVHIVFSFPDKGQNEDTLVQWRKNACLLGKHILF